MKLIWIAVAMFLAVVGPARGQVAVGSQYDSTHVYVAPKDVDAFVSSFLGTFGGTSSKEAMVTVTPTPSRTSSQILQTPVGMVSLFGFVTPIPAHFGDERNGYLVTDMNAAIAEARQAGAEVVVAPFPDAIGMDAIVQWPGGVNLQLYWHTKTPSYPALQHVPENRVYVSYDRVDAFLKAFLAFSHGRITSDEAKAPGVEIGRAGTTFRRVRLESTFGKMLVCASDGQLPYPYGRETTGYEVDDLDQTLAKAAQVGVTVLVPPFASGERRSSVVQFPGGYVAEIHSAAK
jgi:hypothetical protein